MRVPPSRRRREGVSIEEKRGCPKAGGGRGVDCAAWWCTRLPAPALPASLAAGAARRSSPSGLGYALRWYTTQPAPVLHGAADSRMCTRGTVIADPDQTADNQLSSLPWPVGDNGLPGRSLQPRQQPDEAKNSSVTSRGRSCGGAPRARASVSRPCPTAASGTPSAPASFLRSSPMTGHSLARRTAPAAPSTTKAMRGTLPGLSRDRPGDGPRGEVPDLQRLDHRQSGGFRLGLGRRAGPRAASPGRQPH